MTPIKQFPYHLIKAAIASLLPAAFLAGTHWLFSDPLDLPKIVSLWAMSVLAILIARWIEPARMQDGHWLISFPFLLVFFVLIVLFILYAQINSTVLAWLLVSGIFGFSLAASLLITSQRQGAFWGIILNLLIAPFVPGLLLVITQIRARFSEEEFFILLELILLTLYWLTLRISLKWFLPRELAKREPGIQIKPVWFAIAGILAALVLSLIATRSYQNSFYTQETPPLFPGITDQNPFLCSEVEPDNTTYQGIEVFDQLLERVAANPVKSAPEYAMLALAQKDPQWAERFRESLLGEEAKGLFTNPTNSIKYDQYLASRRVYYYWRIRQAFPDLFNPTEQNLLEKWFAAVNRRAMTAEWVDWMYALAYSKLPEGPYENQENGAGLLALLEASGLADPDLMNDNRAYLERMGRGWDARFRNTDDAAIYQPEWIENAWYQSLHSGTIQQENQRKSFQWLMLQALPDGAPIRYNHPYGVDMASITYLAALLLENDHYLWLAGRSLDYLQAYDGTLLAQPGVEQGLPGTGTAPTFGSCVIYGDSGLPNQVGPVAPDKIVFRSGWHPEDAYLLVNLRFSGWHRYKATQTLSLYYQAGPLMSDQLSGDTFRWLPEGRSLFRDKRIPRQNLNGLTIKRSGIDAIIHDLTGVGSEWSQDPPHYAEVTHFETSPLVDMSTTEIANWNGWQHRRSIFFYHSGPLVIADRVQSPPGGEGVILWHLLSEADKYSLENDRLKLRGAPNPAQVVMIPLTDARPLIEWEPSAESGVALQVKYPLESQEIHQSVTVFLTGGWVEADVVVSKVDEQFILSITKEGEQINVDLGETLGTE